MDGKVYLKVKTDTSVRWTLHDESSDMVHLYDGDYIIYYTDYYIYYNILYRHYKDRNITETSLTESTSINLFF